MNEDQISTIARRIVNGIDPHNIPLYRSASASERNDIDRKISEIRADEIKEKEKAEKEAKKKNEPPPGVKL